jgi:hypothetical protein
MEIRKSDFINPCSIMMINPVYISLVALVVSIISLAISSYRAAVDRRLQWEQLRGSVQSRLTSRGVELLTLIEELRRFPGDETLAITKKLIRIAEALVDMRQHLKGMESPPLFHASSCITRFAPLKSEFEDAEPVFDKLRSEVMQSNFSQANLTADGLIQRLYGSEKPNA